MKVLVIGVNTRPVVNSAKKLGYEVYSISYYNPVDLNADKKEYLINDKYHGCFRENYNEKELLSLAEYYVDDIDCIFVCSGIFESKHSKTPDWNVVGNPPKKIKRMSNKYYITKKLENLGCSVPTTYIAYNYSQLEKYLYDLKSIVVKPICGSGGINVHSITLNTFTDKLYNLLKNLEYPVIVQEMITSDSFSASFVGSNFITFNKQIIKNNMYVGNITPYVPNLKTNNKGVQCIVDSFREVIESFDLAGMNGIDFMIKDGAPIIIELNPRILGTFETIELSSNKNLVKYMIENSENQGFSSCGDLKPKTQYMKRILFAEQKLICRIEKQQNIFDIPMYDAIIEKNEPLATAIGKNNDEINKAVDSISKMVINYEIKQRRDI
jgi:predicted ATP-grasp superfamily ATP-dependent carboligase